MRALARVQWLVSPVHLQTMGMIEAVSMIYLRQPR
jgi:hypothetical protein